MHHLGGRSFVLRLIAFLFLSTHSILASKLPPDAEHENLPRNPLLTAKHSPVVIDVAEPFFEYKFAPRQGCIIYGPEQIALSGWSVSGIGDVNGDGIDDAAFSARNIPVPFVNAFYAGVTFVLYGKRGGYDSSIKLSQFLDQANITLGFAVVGAYTGDLSGNSISNAGDPNRD